MIISYTLIWVKIKFSNKNLSNLGIVAFNKQANEVTIKLKFASYKTEIFETSGRFYFRSGLPK